MSDFTPCKSGESACCSSNTLLAIWGTNFAKRDSAKGQYTIAFWTGAITSPRHGVTVLTLSPQVTHIFLLLYWHFLFGQVWPDDCTGTKFYHWGALAGLISLVEAGYW